MWHNKLSYSKLYRQIFVVAQFIVLCSRSQIRLFRETLLCIAPCFNKRAHKRFDFHVIVAGEITTKCYVDIPKVVREVIKDIGYTNACFGLDCQTCAIVTSSDEQSTDISIGVDLLDAWNFAEILSNFKKILRVF